MQKAMKVEITFPARAKPLRGPGAVSRSKPVEVEVVRYDLTESTTNPHDQMYSVRVNGEGVLLVDGAEWQRMLNAFGLGTW